jgi:hypothetical protein
MAVYVLLPIQTHLIFKTYIWEIDITILITDVA